ncbi:hypothetical protein BaRGS_00022423 [Batillaria attramentaria]|uniref:Uncharacterized protein n=1 Tax=Batillaria attramentaria TaxID=370345 RepID=A0ABD0KGR5_9CAEN
MNRKPPITSDDSTYRSNVLAVARAPETNNIQIYLQNAHHPQAHCENRCMGLTATRLNKPSCNRKTIHQSTQQTISVTAASQIIPAIKRAQEVLEVFSFPLRDYPASRLSQNITPAQNLRTIKLCYTQQ